MGNCFPICPWIREEEAEEKERILMTTRWHPSDRCYLAGHVCGKNVYLQEIGYDMVVLYRGREKLLCHRSFLLEK